MALNDRIEQLKNQVHNTSNQQFQIKQNIESQENEIAIKEQTSQNNRNEMQQFIRSVVGQSEIANARDRELLQDKLDKFSFKQQQMNEQVTRLNNNISDVTALESLYRTKRDEMEQCYQEERESLTRQNKALEKQISKHKSELNQIQSEVQKNKNKLGQIQEEIKKYSLINSFKTKFIGHYLMYLIVGIVVFLVIEFLGTNIIEWITSAM